MKLGIFLVLGFTGLLVMASVLNYKQTDCKYYPADMAIWIKFDSGVLKKGIRFSSDGIIFDSDVFVSTATGYERVIRLVYDEGENGFGHLTVGMKSLKDKYFEDDVGLIEAHCWENLKTLVAANPLSQHIEMVVVGEGVKGVGDN